MDDGFECTGGAPRTALDARTIIDGALEDAQMRFLERLEQFVRSDTAAPPPPPSAWQRRSEEHTSELQSL